MSCRGVTGLLAAFAAVTLGGCVSLLPQAKPVQLYELSPEVEAASGRPAVNIRLEAVRFQQAAAGDRLLTVRDGTAAYVGGARWVSPAETLFEESLARAFARHARNARLVPHSAVAGTSYALTVDMDRFQVNLEDKTPKVEVGLRARLIRFPEQTIVDDWRIDMARQADTARVASIVRAYDAALGAALTTLVEQTDDAVAGR